MSDKLLIKDRDVVTPGEILATGMSFLPGQGTYRENEHVHSNMLGLAQVSGKVIKILPLRGSYTPKFNDRIICKVVNVHMSGWSVDTGSAYHGMISLKDATNDFIRRGANLTDYFAPGEWVFAKVTNVTSQKLIDLSVRGPGLRKLGPGRIITINCQKVPRVIGKEGSMVSLLKDNTGCYVYVGQNGRIWISGEAEKERLVCEIIKYIEANAHKKGLTDKVQAFLKAGKVKE